LPKLIANDSFFISGGLLNSQQVVVFIVLIESGNGLHVIIVCSKITPFFFQILIWKEIKFKMGSYKLFQHHMKVLLIFNNTKNQ
jgi:hypothetical protein